MADKNRIEKVMKFVKIGFKVLQDIILQVLSLDTLRTDINVRSGINVRAGKFGKNNKRTGGKI